MSDFETTFKEAIGWVVKSKHPDLDIAEVTEFNEEVRDDGGCPTCGPYYTHTVEVWFTKSDGSTGWAELDGRLSELISAVGGYPGWSELNA